VIATEHGFASINSTMTIDLIGRCASETIGGHYYASSGGQADFARGAMYSDSGQRFVVLHSTTGDESISKTPRRRHHDPLA
jgi:acyl-CoA hydrolase